MTTATSIVSKSAIVAFLMSFREWKKYHFILFILNYLHYYWAASKPTLFYQKTPITQHLLNNCSLLVEKYHPTWYLFNGHLQTLFLALGNRFPVVQYRREHVHLTDGGLVSLDWAVPPTMDDVLRQHNHPTVLLLHGHCGGSWENYMRNAADKLLHEGWRVVVMNARGCSKTPVLTARIFNGADTGDIREVVAHLRRKHVPSAPLLAVGFSLGSNLLVKYLGQEGERCPLNAAVSVGNPFDAMEIYRHLNDSAMTYHVYYRAMTKKFLKLFFEESNVHEHIADKHPTVDMCAMKECSFMWDVDHLMTLKVFGYKSVSEYYRDCSSTPYIQHVRIPLLCLSAKDDPVCVHSAIPIDDCLANDKIVLAITDRGGHLGFFTGNNVFSYPETWSSHVVAQFCNAVVDAVSSDEVIAVQETHETKLRPHGSAMDTKASAERPPAPPVTSMSPSRMQPPMSPLRIQPGFHDPVIDEVVLCDGVPMHQVFSVGAAFAGAYLVYSKMDHVVGRWWWC
ncbi:Aste57867_24794 [Aphanomyces stellatus]|uniref:Aste57867_24794 protein n=1 Tax=Aphanomyces stellatus TaxID=120398 RepID=A0A485LS12_9STRA|nr:hypothetical protein As57867_024716 [Aphanomyces stellatus]VFU01429.1 Aste57867_24794 [Aphanomyces stellatus]